jgi:hypothetical protein
VGVHVVAPGNKGAVGLRQSGFVKALDPAGR